MTHVVVLGPNQGGWPLFHGRIKELLGQCTAIGNIEALRADNLSSLRDYLEDQPVAAAELNAAFERRREELRP